MKPVAFGIPSSAHVCLVACSLLLTTLLIGALPLAAAVTVESVSAEAEVSAIVAPGSELTRWRCADAGGELRNHFEWRWVELEIWPRGCLEIEVASDGPPRWIQLDGRERAIRVKAIEEARAQEQLREIEALVDAGDVEGALDRLESALKEKQAVPHPLSSSLLAEAVAQLLLQRGQHRTAVAIRQRQLALAPPGTPAAVICLDLARAALDSNDFPAAATFAQECEGRVGSVAPEGLAVAEAYFILGTARFRAGDPHRALEAHERALQLRRERAPASLAYASSIASVGLIVRHQEPQRARQMLEEALAVQQRLAPGSYALAATTANLGVVAKEVGDLSSAERYYADARSLFEKLGNEVAVAGLLNNLGEVARSRSHFAEAEAAFRQSLEIRRRLAPGTQLEAQTWNNLGLVAYDRNELESARTALLKAIAIKEKVAPDSPSLAASIMNLGLCAAAARSYDEALDAYERALAIQRVREPDSVAVSRTLNNIGVVYQERGDLDGARRRFEEARDLLTGLVGESFELTRPLNNLAQVLQRQGKLAEAEALYSSILSVRARVVPDSYYLAESHHLLAGLLRETGRHDEAVAHLEQAAQALERQLAVLGGSDIAQARFRADYQPIFDDLIELKVERGDLASALTVLERSRVVRFLAELDRYDLLADRIPAEDRLRLRQLADRRNEVSERLRGLDLRSASDAERLGLVGSAQEIDGEREALWHSLVERFDLPTRKTSGFALPAVPAIVFHVSKTGVRAFARDDAGQVALLVVDASIQEIASRVAELREMIELREPEPSIRRRAESLGAALVAPAYEALGRPHDLVIVPDGPLLLVPWAALRLAGADGDGAWLPELASLRVVPSLSSLSAVVTRSPRHTKAPRVVAFADPAASLTAGELVTSRPGGRRPELGPLPGSRAEVAGIASILGSSVTPVTGLEATEARLLAEAPHSDILHLACHGTVDPVFPMSSSLVLADSDAPDDDGILQAWEIAQGLRCPGALVVLSACDTGVGEIVESEGVYGLARAFHLAGATTVVSTLWAVADASSAAFMADLYRAIGAGRSVHESLREATGQRLRGETVEWRHPYYWAGYQVSGSGLPPVVPGSPPAASAP